MQSPAVTKVNNTMVLLSLLSLGVFYNANSAGTKQSVRDIGKSLSSIGQFLLEQSYNVDRSPSPVSVLKEYLSENEQKLSEDIKHLTHELKKETCHYTKLLNKTHSISKDKGSRKGFHYKNNLNAYAELHSQKMYNLQQSLSVMNSELALVQTMMNSNTAC